MIKIPMPPLKSIDQVRYIDTSGNPAPFTHADYASARDTGTAEPVPKDQQPDSGVLLAVPQSVRTAILMLVAHWYANREPVTAGTAGSVPHHVDQLLWNNAVVDFAPTRG